MIFNSFSKGKINCKKVTTLICIFLFTLITITNSCSVVQQRERGIKYTFGKVDGEVIQPGLKFKIPFVSKIKKYSIVPKTYEVIFSVGGASDSAAITKDMQGVGTTVNIKYQFDENRIMEIATKYGDGNIESTMKPIIQSAVKEVLGNYSIYDIPPNQAEISKKISNVIMEKMTAYPICVNAVALTNFTWSSSFETRVEETAAAAQQAKKAEQELKLAETNAQRQVVEAQAKLEAEKLNAEAKKVAADAEAYEMKKKNESIAATLSIQKQSWEHEEKMKYFEKWNGVEPGSTATQFIVTPQYSALTTVK